MSHPTNPALTEMRLLMREWIGEEDTPHHDQLEGIFYALTQDEDLREKFDKHLKGQLERYNAEMSVGARPLGDLAVQREWQQSG